MEGKRKKPSDLEIVKQTGSLSSTPLAKGDDSSVFSFKSNNDPIPGSVVKFYNQRGLGLIMDPKKRERILEKYYRDTLEVYKMLEENPNLLNQYITIKGEAFPLKYKVIPQGSVILGVEKGFAPGDTYEASFGQKFIVGKNFEDLDRSPGGPHLETDERIDPRQKVFVGNDSLCNGEIHKMVEELFAYLSNKIGSYFEYSEANIKPFLEEKEGYLLIVITDLSADLKKYGSQIKNPTK